MRRLVYQERYGYRFRDAIRAEFWWRVEHAGRYPARKEDGPMARIHSYGYVRRKGAERRGVSTFDQACSVSPLRVVKKEAGR